MRRPSARGLAAAAACAAAACWSAPAPRGPSGAAPGPVPGTLWITAAQPWRATEEPAHVAATADAALLAARGGWVGRLDLATGRLARERRLAGVRIERLLAVPGGGWLVAGARGGRTVALALDAATLEPTTVVEGPALAERLDPAEIGAVALDAGIAIGGPGVALAIYDPATWSVRRTFEPGGGWSELAGGGGALYASLAGELHRLDPATGRGLPLPGESLLAADGTYRVGRAPAEAGAGITITAEGRPPVRLAVEPSHVALDAAGGRIAVREGAQVRIYALADGAALGAHDLGAAARSGAAAAAFAGGRLVVTAGAVVRAIDPATGAITPAGDPPYAPGPHLGVGADGAVLHVGAHALQLAGGAVASARPLGDAAVALGAPGEVARYAALHRGPGGTWELQLRAAAGGGLATAWRLPRPASGAWLGGSGEAVVELSGRSAISLVRAAGRGADARLEPLVELSPEAAVHDVDPDAGLAAVSRGETVHVLPLDGRGRAIRVPRPGCEHFGAAGLERGGDRLYVSGGRVLAVYRRATGARADAARPVDAARPIDAARPSDAARPVGAARLAAGGDVAFVPGGDEVLVGGGEGGALVLWDAARGEERVVAGVSGIDRVRVSPDGRRAALAFVDGRIALVDLDALRAAVPPRRAEAAPQAERCGGDDPLDVPREPEGRRERGGGGGDGGDP